MPGDILLLSEQFYCQECKKAVLTNVRYDTYRSKACNREAKGRTERKPRKQIYDAILVWLVKTIRYVLIIPIGTRTVLQTEFAVRRLNKEQYRFTMVASLIGMIPEDFLVSACKSVHWLSVLRLVGKRECLLYMR